MHDNDEQQLAKLGETLEGAPALFGRLPGFPLRVSAGGGRVRSGCRLLALVVVVAVALAGCRSSEERQGSAAASPAPSSSSFDTLDIASWPTEAMDGEVGPLRSALVATISGGEASSEWFTDDFRGEPFAARERSLAEVISGVEVRPWADADPTLDDTSFLADWQLWIASLGSIDSVETHTWELQARGEADGPRALEATTALWILGTLEDGRRREERLHLVVDFVDEGAPETGDGEADPPSDGWRIERIRVREGRTSISPGFWLEDVTAAVLPPGHDQSGAQIYTDAGPALVDFDGDGDVDLFLPRLHAPALLYENDGHGQFSDVTAVRGLAVSVLRQGTNSGLFVDFDGDGVLDLAVGIKNEGVALFRQEGERFRRVDGGTLLGGPGQWESLAAADYDGDGRVDLYVANYNLIDADHQPESYVDAEDGLPNRLFRNVSDDGSVRFVDVTEETGLDVGAERWSYAAAWADYDRDGDMDLYVANDYGPNSLYRNRGDGRFDEVASEVGAEDFGNGMGVVWADVDGDTDLDLYVSNMQSFAGHRITRLETFPGDAEQRALYTRFSRGNTLLVNAGDGTFDEKAEEAGVQGAFWAWGGIAFDAECDGDLDLMVSGGFYSGESAADT